MPDNNIITKEFGNDDPPPTYIFNLDSPIFDLERSVNTAHSVVEDGAVILIIPNSNDPSIHRILRLREPIQSSPWIPGWAPNSVELHSDLIKTVINENQADQSINYYIPTQPTLIMLATSKIYKGTLQNSFGKKRRRKVKKKKIPISLKRFCKKLGVRLTVKRGKKRVYKSVTVLKRQCANKKKRKKRRRKRKK
jgi:hypothetical protein